MDIVHGPSAQLVAGNLIYQVTLASGMIITNPSGFGIDERSHVLPTAIVTEGGRILSAPKTKDEIIGQTTSGGDS